MNTLRQWIGAGIVGILVSGCATQMPAGEPIINPEERLEFDGISVLPPQEKDWFLGPSAIYEVTFQKQLSAWSKNPQSHSYIAAIMRHDLYERELRSAEDLLSFVDSTIKMGGDRYQIMDSHITLDDTRSNALGTDCAQFDMVKKVKDNPYAPDAVSNLIVHGFQCRHPSSSKVVINAFCTERYPEGGQPVAEALNNECAAFLNNVQFKPLRTQTQAPDLGVPEWQLAQWQQIIAAARQANERGNKVSADQLCYQAIYFADTNTIKALYQYADLLEQQKREESVAVRAKAEKLAQLKPQPGQRAESKTTYLGFAPVEMLDEYADVLEESLQTTTAESIRTLSRAYQYTQEVQANRYQIMHKGGDPSGLCVGFD